MRPRTTLNCPICGHPEAQDSRQFLKMVFVAAHMTLCVNYKKNLVLFPPPQSALLFPSSRFSVSLGPRSIRPCWHDDGGGTGHEEEVGRREMSEGGVWGGVGGAVWGAVGGASRREFIFLNVSAFFPTAAPPKSPPTAPPTAPPTSPPNAPAGSAPTPLPRPAHGMAC